MDGASWFATREGVPRPDERRGRPSLNRALFLADLAKRRARRSGARTSRSDRRPHEGVQRLQRHPRLPLPALRLGEALAVLLLRDGGDEAPVGVDGLEGALFGGDVVGERAHQGAFGNNDRLIATGEAGGGRAREGAPGGAPPVGPHAPGLAR